MLALFRLWRGHRLLLLMVCPIQKMRSNPMHSMKFTTAVVLPPPDLAHAIPAPKGSLGRSSGVSKHSPECVFGWHNGILVEMLFVHYFTCIHKNGTSDGTDTVTSKLPGDSASLIHRFTVSANGTQLSQGTDSYHTVARILKIGGESRDKDMSADNVLGFSQVDDTAAADHVTMVFSQFLGLFSQASVRYLDRIMAWTPSLTGGIVVVRDPCLHGRFSIGSLCVGPSDTMSWSPTIGLLITSQEPIHGPDLGAE